MNKPSNRNNNYALKFSGVPIYATNKSESNLLAEERADMKILLTTRVYIEDYFLVKQYIRSAFQQVKPLRTNYNFVSGPFQFPLRCMLPN